MKPLDVDITENNLEKWTKQLCVSYKRQPGTNRVVTGNLKQKFMEQLTHCPIVSLHRKCVLDPNDCKLKRLQRTPCDFFNGKHPYKVSAISKRKLPIYHGFKKKTIGKTSQRHIPRPLYRGLTRWLYDSFKEIESDILDQTVPLATLKKELCNRSKSFVSDNLMSEEVNTLTPSNNTCLIYQSRSPAKRLRKRVYNSKTRKFEVAYSARSKTTSISNNCQEKESTTSQKKSTPTTYWLQDLVNMLNNLDSVEDLEENAFIRSYINITPTAENENGSITIELPKTLKYKCKVDLTSVKNFAGLTCTPEFEKEKLKWSSVELNKIMRSIKANNKTSPEVENNVAPSCSTVQSENFSLQSQGSNEIFVRQNDIRAFTTYLPDGAKAVPYLLIPAAVVPATNQSEHTLGDINSGSRSNSKNRNRANSVNEHEETVPVRVTSLNGLYDHTHYFNLPNIYQHSENELFSPTKNTQPKKYATNKNQKVSPRKRGRKLKTTENVTKKENVKKPEKQKLKKTKLKNKSEPPRRATVVKCRVSRPVENTENIYSRSLPKESLITNNESYIAGLDMPLINEGTSAEQSNGSQQTQPSSGVFSAQSYFANGSSVSCTPNSNTYNNMYTPFPMYDFKGFNTNFGNVNVINSLAARNSYNMFSTTDVVDSAESKELLERFHLGEVGDTQRNYDELFLGSETSPTSTCTSQFEELSHVDVIGLSNEKNSVTVKHRLSPTETLTTQFLDLSNFDHLEGIESSFSMQKNADMPATDIGNNIIKCQNTAACMRKSNNENNRENISNNCGESNQIPGLQQPLIGRRRFSTDVSTSCPSKLQRLNRFKRFSLHSRSQLENSPSRQENIFRMGISKLGINNVQHILDTQNSEVNNSSHTFLSQKEHFVSNQCRKRNLPEKQTAKKNDIKIIENIVISRPLIDRDKFINNAKHVDGNVVPQQFLVDSIETFREDNRSFTGTSSSCLSPFEEFSERNSATTLNRSLLLSDISVKDELESDTIRNKSSETISIPTTALNEESKKLAVSSTNVSSIVGQSVLDKSAVDVEGKYDESKKKELLKDNQSCVTSAFKNDFDIFLPPLELESKLDHDLDFLDYDCDSVLSLQSEKDLNLSPDGEKNEENKGELINGNNISNIHNSAPTGDNHELIVKSGEIAETSELMSLISQTQKITRRRQSETGIFKPKSNSFLRTSRFSIDQMPIVIANVSECSGQKFSKNFNDNALNGPSVYGKDIVAEQALLQKTEKLKPNLPSHRNFALSTEPNSNGNNYSNANPILIEVPADPVLLSSNDLEGFLNTVTHDNPVQSGSTQIHKNTPIDIEEWVDDRNCVLKTIGASQNQLNVRMPYSNVTPNKTPNLQLNGKDLLPNTTNQNSGTYLSHPTTSMANILKFFNIHCFNSLSDMCSTKKCCSNPHGPLRELGSFQSAISNMALTDVNILYMFVRKRLKLFLTYFNAFWPSYTMHKSVDNLCRLIVDGERYGCSPPNALVLFFDSLQKCGLSKQKACEIILKHSKQLTGNANSTLMEIIIDSNWTLFGENVRNIIQNSNPTPVFSASLVEKMAASLLQNYSNQLFEVLVCCFTCIDASEVEELYHCPALKIIMESHGNGFQ